QVEEVGDDLAVLMMRRYAKRRKEWGEEIAGQVERSIALRSVDRSWTHHIDTMDNLRQSIHLRGYANRNPLQDYVNEGYALFKEMMDSISIEAVLNLLNAQVQIKKPETQEGQNPDATNDGLTPEEPALVAKEQ
ncbi:MAG: hypothetical protein WCQ71_04065, partial [Bacilli bacterium]